MAQSNFLLTKKTKLTKDVFELEFECSESLKAIAWQFITFMLPQTKFARAYSILKQIWNNFYFTIKRLEDWRGWSKEICDIEVGQTLRWIWPVGHFTLKNLEKNKLFIWTWTWIVPLYFQIKYLSEINSNIKYKLILWNRSKNDLYYIDDLNSFKNENFDFEVYLSQEDNTEYKFWRVTDFLTKENIKDFEEFYICWNPNMVDDVSAKLSELWVWIENIFTEKY